MKTKIFAILLVLLLAGTSISIPAADAATKLKAGASNGDVWDLQYRLKAMGYFNQPLDGHFGAHTRSALIRFQKAYGLTVDGVAGAKTWKQLRKYSLNLKEMDILARVVYSEARGEPYKGQVAVAAVVMNRIQSGKFPSNIQDVVFQPWAFTAVNDGQFWLTPNRSAYLAALDAVRGWDPSKGSLYYFNPDTATSEWIWSRPQKLKIGRHIFAG
ncbi:spore cortex-lytic enzyme [Cohnella pontilimi]|uniref:spore cortex-lytic enzyme n=1 Tax=Cohnella pontilimi TaxID=2564100 RepID=UPI003CCC6A49